MSGPRTNAAFYAAPVSEFLAASDEEVYAPLASPHGYTLAPEQLSAWRLQLPVLRAALRGLARVPQEQGPVPFGDEAVPAPTAASMSASLTGFCGVIPEPRRR